MYLSDLKPAAGSKKAPTRKGRGIGSGLGKTAGKGHKGQKARSGGGVRPGFEGGQSADCLREVLPISIKKLSLKLRFRISISLMPIQ